MRTRKVAIAFGQVLREIRLEKGVTQDSLASQCDVDRTYPSLLERGLRSPTLAMVFRLSEALDISPAVVVTRSQEQLRQLRDLS